MAHRANETFETLYDPLTLKQYKAHKVISFFSSLRKERVGSEVEQYIKLGHDRSSFLPLRCLVNDAGECSLWRVIVH